MKVVSVLFIIGTSLTLWILGGMELITKERRWTTLATKMGLKTANNKGIGGILRTHYERVVYPYVIFETGKNTKKVNVGNGKVKAEDEDRDKDYVPHHILSRMAVKPPTPSKYQVFWWIKLYDILINAYFSVCSQKI